MKVTTCLYCGQRILLEGTGAWFTQGGSDTPYRCEEGPLPYHVPSGKTLPTMNYNPLKEVNMDKTTFSRAWENIKREVEEKPIVVMGVLGSLLYGSGHIMDANTRRKNAANERKRIKVYDKNVERMIRKEKKK